MTNIEFAKSLGKMAYETKKCKASCEDKTFMDFLATVSTGKIGSCLPYLKAWNNGWHKAHNIETNAELEAMGFWK